MLSALPEGSALVLPAASSTYRTGDVAYPFTQQSDFYYLTGFSEPDATLVCVKAEGREQSILFCESKDEEKARWNGPVLGEVDALTVLGVDAAYPLDEIDDVVTVLLENIATLYFSFDAAETDTGFSQVQNWVLSAKQRFRHSARVPDTLKDSAIILHAMRMQKHADEVSLMRQAGSVSACAHRDVMALIHPGITEQRIQAELLYRFMLGGCAQEAYPSIVAGAERACVLHYEKNNETLRSGDLVLIDAGGEYKHYAADITRTLPVNGKFNDAQRAIYNIVLSTQKTLFDAIKPGITMAALEKISVESLTRGLLDAGILTGDFDTLLKTQAVRRYYPHGFGHMLGLDTHDVSVKECFGDSYTVNLAAGMVITVEPGIYILSDDSSVDEQFRGIGVRIEDNVLVTETGYDILTNEAPREIAEIEACMGKGAHGKIL